MTKDLEHGIEEMSANERKELKSLLTCIATENLEGLLLEKLKVRNDIFRIRQGNLRVLYQQKDDGIAVLAVERNVAAA